MSAMAFLSRAPSITPAQRGDRLLLIFAAKTFGRLLRSWTAVDRAHQAIAVLEAESSTLDQLEWAERTLCGMIHCDPPSFLEHRAGQS